MWRESLRLSQNSCWTGQRKEEGPVAPRCARRTEPGPRINPSEFTNLRVNHSPRHISRVLQAPRCAGRAPGTEAVSKLPSGSTTAAGDC